MIEQSRMDQIREVAQANELGNRVDGETVIELIDEVERLRKFIACVGSDLCDKPIDDAYIDWVINIEELGGFQTKPSGNPG